MSIRLRTNHRRLGWLLLAALQLTCSGANKKSGPGQTATHSATPPVPDWLAAVTSVLSAHNRSVFLRLKPVNAAQAPASAPENVVARTLDADQTAAVLARLPVANAQPTTNTQPPATPSNASKPPIGQIAGPALEPNITPISKPSTAPHPNQNRGPLTVVRVTPSGDVEAAAETAIVFSQPMVALGAHADTAENPPARLTPAVAGRWRWLGTQTLVFTPELPFPAASSFKVEIPAGITALSGQRLAEPTRFAFRTPTPRLLSPTPSSDEALGLEPMFLLLFDQPIDPVAALQHTWFTAGGEQVAARFASEQEVVQDADLIWQLSDLGPNAPGRFLVVRPVTPLARDGNARVTVAAGTPSVAGPRTTPVEQGFEFVTYRPLAVTQLPCDRSCPPDEAWEFRFNNPIDASATKAVRDQLSIVPAITDLQVEIERDTLTLSGTKAPSTDYQVTLPAAIRDEYGQTLTSAGRTPMVLSVGREPPRFEAPEGLLVLDPHAPTPIYTVHSKGVARLAVQLRALEPTDWAAFAEYTAYEEEEEEDDDDDDDGAKERGIKRKRPPLPGTLVDARQVEVAGAAGELAITDIDLSPALRAGIGHALVVVEPVEWPTSELDDKPRAVAWVQVTRLGLDALADESHLLAWATSLTDGTPVDGASLEIAPHGVRGRTGADGLAEIALPVKAPAGNALLIARQGADTAILPASPYWDTEPAWLQSKQADDIRVFVFDDRALYRPGEQVALKGWVRRVGQSKGGDVWLPDPDRALGYEVTDGRSHRIAHGELNLTATGGFHLEFTIPETIRAGYGRVSFTLGEHRHRHRYMIGAFRRPEFEVTVRARKSVLIAGEPSVLSARARYYTGGGPGGGLEDADVRWRVSTHKAEFRPPGHGDFEFGAWIPWWRSATTSWRVTETLVGKTDGTGTHDIALDIKTATPTPLSIAAEATVFDVNRQRWSAKSAVLVHPADVYVGLRRADYFVEGGQPIRVDVAAVDLDGRAAAGRPVSVTAVGHAWIADGDELKRIERAPIECAFTSGSKPHTCQFAPVLPGTYQITATVRDARGRVNQSQTTVWVSGEIGPPSRHMSAENVALIPDKQRYAPGDTARVLVTAPFSPAHGLLTVRRSGIVHHRPFLMSERSRMLDVAIEDAHTPNLSIAVDLVGASPRENADGILDTTIPARPALASGTLSLALSLAHRRLAVTARPRERVVRPGARTDIDIDVRDSRGVPVADAEVAVVVVDEAILALTDKSTPDPLPAFYPHRPAGVETVRTRALIELVRPELFKAPALSAPRTRRARPPEVRIGNAVALGRGPVVTMRTDFRPLALFAPALRTGKRGRARVSVTLPDSLTRYRVMAVAAHGAGRFGADESSITARLPLMIRPSLPRFLNVGDRAELPVVVHNQSARPMTVDLAMRTTNLTLTAGAGQRVDVPAGTRTEVRFPASAGAPGRALVQVAGIDRATGVSDARASELPVQPPLTSEVFATYGALDSRAIAQPVAVPGSVERDFGGLEVTTSATQVHAATDALAYLSEYRYQCSEQLASRILAMVAVRDVLTHFAADSAPSAADVESALARDLGLLAERQQPGDGGFGVWTRWGASLPYFNVHVAHALVRAHERGVALPVRMLERASAYLSSVDQTIPADYPRAARALIAAYALYVRARLGDVDVRQARALLGGYDRLDQLPLEAAGWLLAVFARVPEARAERQVLLRFIENRATETTASATFASAFERGAHLVVHSSRRADSVLLEALIDAYPQSDLIPKLVRGLSALRTRGAWRGTQENAFAILALRRYAEVYETTAPRFTARLWLDDRLVGAHAFLGRYDQRHRVAIPMRQALGGTHTLTLAKDRPGRLYYRIAMRYASAARAVPAADHGFAVTRVYEAVDDPDDVRRQPDGAYTVKAGARVRVRLAMTALTRRYHVALSDSLPAGFEAQNSDLKAAAESLPEPTSGPARSGQNVIRWWRTWYEHQAIYDSHVDAFATRLAAGTYEYTYIAVATTPGRFSAPPTKAEEMYAPETFGRSASDAVVIAPAP